MLGQVQCHLSVISQQYKVTFTWSEDSLRELVLTFCDVGFSSGGQ